MSEKSFLPHPIVEDPPKSPLKKGTLSSLISPFLRGARGDRGISDTFQITSQYVHGNRTSVYEELKLISLYTTSETNIEY